MQLANQEAQRFNHEYIGTEHILLGLVREGTGVAANVLKNFGVELPQVRIEVQNMLQSGPEMITMGKLPQTPRSKKVIEFAIEESEQLGHNFVGTEHLLLGLLKVEEGAATDVLSNLNVKLDKVREEILRLLGIGEHSGRTLANATGVGQTQKYPRVPEEVVQLTRDLNYLKKCSLDPIEVCDQTMEAIKIGLDRRTANNLFLEGTQEQADIYIEAIIRTGIQLSFHDFAQSKYALDAAGYANQVTQLFDSLFRSLATAIVFHNFQRLLQIEAEAHGAPLGDILEPWLEFPNVHLIAYGNVKEKASVVDERPHIGRHFSVVELPPLSKTQVQQMVAREVRALERFHLCTFADDAVARVIDHCLSKDPEPGECRAILDVLDQAAAKMQLDFKEEDKTARKLDQAIKIWMEQFAASAVAGDAKRVDVESAFVNETFNTRQKIKPFPVVGIEHVNEFLPG